MATLTGLGLIVFGMACCFYGWDMILGRGRPIAGALILVVAFVAIVSGMAMR